MKTLIADSGSTKTQWALVENRPGLPQVVHTATTIGLNPLYVTPAQIAAALREVLTAVGEGHPDELYFYGSGCSGERVAVVEQALRQALTPMTSVSVESDLVGAARALTSGPAMSSSDHVIVGILGTGAIAALYDPASRSLMPMPALGYILGDEGSGAWFGRHLLSDYLKRQMPLRAREAFEEDFGEISVEQAICHVYQLPCPNRYLATFAAFLGRHLDLPYALRLAYTGLDAFWRRNILPIEEKSNLEVREVRLVGSVAWHLRSLIEKVAESHGYVVTQVLQNPIEGLMTR